MRAVQKKFFEVRSQSLQLLPPEVQRLIPQVLSCCPAAPASGRPEEDENSEETREEHGNVFASASSSGGDREHDNPFSGGES